MTDPNSDYLDRLSAGDAEAARVFRAMPIADAEPTPRQRLAYVRAWERRKQQQKRARGRL